MPDKYDDAIAYLTEHQDSIHEAWLEGGRYSVGEGSTAGACLFAYVKRLTVPYCLTMIRECVPRGSIGNELIAEIHEDERLPDDVEDITVDHLPVFAEWQRRLDVELGEDRNGA